MSMMEKDSMILLEYQYAVCGYLLEAHRVTWNSEKIPQERITAVLKAYETLRQSDAIPLILRESYGVMDVCIRVLGEKNEISPELQEKGLNHIKMIQEVMETNSSVNIILPQINQLVKQTIVWLFLLLNKNKKCSKPAVAKEPVS